VDLQTQQRARGWRREGFTHCNTLHYTATHCNTLQRVCQAELDALMKHADMNNDGKIQYKEWIYKLSGGREGGDAKG